MAVENWIDEITKLWDTVSDGQGSYVRSYRVYEKAEFPEAMNIFPSAITYTLDVTPVYSAGGVQVEFWNGVTEFHISPDVDKSRFPGLMLYFARIRAAAASNLQLNGKVAHFLIRIEGGPGIQGPVVLQYGSEAPHHGLMVFWKVKELL